MKVAALGHRQPAGPGGDQHGLGEIKPVRLQGVGPIGRVQVGSAVGRHVDQPGPGGVDGLAHHLAPPRCEVTESGVEAGEG